MGQVDKPGNFGHPPKKKKLLITEKFFFGGGGGIFVFFCFLFSFEGMYAVFKHLTKKQRFQQHTKLIENTITISVFIEKCYIVMKRVPNPTKPAGKVPNPTKHPV